MLDLLKDCCNCFLLSLVKKHLTRHIIYNVCFRNWPSILHILIYLSLLNSFLFLSRFSVSLKSLNNYIFRRFAYKSLLKGCLRYKTILCHKLALNVWLMNFFIWRKNNVSFSRYPDFCIFVKPANFKICDIIINIAA